MITDFAKEKLARLLHEFFTEIQFGTGADASNPFVNSLDAPLNTATLTLTNVMSNDTTIDFTYELVGSTTGISEQTIQEVGIFGALPENDQFANVGNADPGASYTTESIMLIRIPIDPIRVSASEVYDVVFTLEVE